MSGSQGRRDSVHIWWRTYFRANDVRCWECGGPPYAADHNPPLSLYGGNRELWRAAGGTYRSHCQYHSAKQGANITNTRHHPTPSRTW